MKTVSLSGSLRENVGKKDAKAVRNAGKVPCVLYGGDSQLHFTTEVAGFKPIIFTPDTYLIELDLSGKKYDVILQDVQYHPVSDKILHADFLLAPEGKPVIVAMPVKIKGAAPGVLRGGNLHVISNKIKMKGLVKNIPEFIEVDISKLEIGDSIKVKDLDIDKVTMLSAPNTVVAAVRTARVIEVVEEELEEGEEGEEGEGEEGGEGEETKETKE